MADNLDLAIRIRADLQSALSNLKEMEGGVAGVGREMRRGSIAARVFGSTIGKLVSGDLIARGLTAVTRRVRQFIADSVQAATNADSLARSMRAAWEPMDCAWRFYNTRGRSALRIVEIRPSSEGIVRIAAVDFHAPGTPGTYTWDDLITWDAWSTGTAA